MNITLARDLRPVPQHIVTPGTRPFCLSHSGEVIIQATMWDVNLRDLYDLLRGGRYDQFIRFRILEGAAIYATAGYALDTGDWPTGTTLTLENRGRVQGKGGDGGYASTGGAWTGEDGEDGTHAMLIQHDITIDNTNGEIFGGGGGGGGGGFSSVISPSLYRSGGGGGGGGAGALVGAGGNHYPPFVDDSRNHSSWHGQDGAAGTGDAGGAGGAYGTPNGPVSPGGAGGDGGGPGAAGAAGGNGVSTNGGAGGAAGNAIVQSGGTATFSGGNNSTQVKGSIV